MFPSDCFRLLTTYSRPVRTCLYQMLQSKKAIIPVHPSVQTLLDISKQLLQLVTTTSEAVN